MNTTNTQSIDITQKYFRVMLDSMSTPGEFFTLPFTETGLNPLFTLLSTLLDNEVMFSVIGKDVQESFIDSVYTMTKSEYVSASKADYVIVSGEDSLGYLKNVSRGEIEFPDRGACVIYPVENLNATNTFVNFSISGPGVKSKKVCTLGCVCKSDIQLIKEINSDFPLGIDVIFVDAKGLIVSIPRSSKITLEEP